MSMQTALSGLNAATTELGVISHNVANAGTTGFKGSRAEFGDLFSVSPYGLTNNQTGAGVKVAAVSQQFTQGNIEFTENFLDLAISGQGFFTMSENGVRVYSRAGNFSIDRDGYVVNPAAQRLQVFPPDGSGGFNTGSLTDLQLTVGENPPVATTTVTLTTNLPADAPQPATAPFDPNDASSYNHAASLTTYDSLGVSHVQTTYFVKTANPNEWAANTYMDGTAIGGAQTLQYSTAGALVTPAGGQLALPAWTPPSGAAAMNISIDVAASTQFGDSFAISELNQDGNTTGRLVGVEVDSRGVVFALFSNGRSQGLGQVAMAKFTNTQGLQKLGDNSWSETYESGQPLIGQAGTSSFGLIQSSALEASNVDMTGQLVAMITAQRSFQANAQVISTQDQITQTVLNIR
ncbi:MAG: flagellar hook protein FlgE [Pseudomonadota bacterium]